MPETKLSPEEQRADDERYWMSRFATPAPVLDLPCDRPRQHPRSFSIGREEAMLDTELVAALDTFAVGQGYDLRTTLFTGFSTLLMRLCGHSDVVVGIAAGDAGDASADHRAGILPIRSVISPGTGFAVAVAQTGRLLRDAIRHRNQDFDALLRKLGSAGHAESWPLASVFFGFQAAPGSDAARPAQAGLPAGTSGNDRFDLFLAGIAQDDGSLLLRCDYNADLFDAESIRRWMDALDTLLRSAVARPDGAWDRLDWVSTRERQALRALQPPRSEYDANLLVHQRFAAHATAAPDRVAIAFSAQELSYAALERRSNAIAHALRDRGVGRGALVGVHLEREPDLFASVLGILKAGAAFVPLDPTYPKDRLDFMVADSALQAIVSSTVLLGTIAYPRGDTLVLDEDIDAQAWNRVEPLAPDERSATPDTAAYVIYTSGSTGRPKGVVVPHRALVNLLCSMQRSPGFSADDSLVAVTVMSFDMSIPELFLPLAVGGRVVVATREDPRDGHELRRLLEASGATCMQATPSGWRLLVAAGWTGGKGFKALAGGESLPQDLAVALRDGCGELWNMYGPTETTVWSTCARLRMPEQGIPIGEPIANTSVWVLDGHGQPCPVGVPGELWIGGDGVTLGYLNRPELTAERFVTDPFSDRTGARMYRTGDRGRWRNDGMLEHLGRLDSQLKVRGYRIEPGEIEANLAGCPGVEACVVVVREDRPGDVRLVAYVVAETGADPGVEVMRRHLQSVLPAYMVPQHIVRLDAIPLSPNGKVDRDALPVPDQVQPTITRGAPRNPLEERIAMIVGEVLALPDIGVDDDFLALRGHSRAAQLAAHLSRELGTTLSPQMLSGSPTVARLAEAIVRISDDAAADAASAGGPDIGKGIATASPGTGATGTGTDVQDIYKETSMQPTNAAIAGSAISESRESYLTGIWSDLLGFEVKPSDNFFDVGGNSMLAVQMSERVAKETGYRIKLMQLAAQSASDIATDLPAGISTSGNPGGGSKLVRSVKRLFGLRAAAE